LKQVCAHVDVGSEEDTIDDEMKTGLVVRVMVVPGLGDVKREVVPGGSVVVVRIV